MATVTIAMLAKEVGQKRGISAKKVHEVIDTLIRQINAAVEEGDRVRLAGLGSFHIQLTEPRVQRLPTAPGQVHVRETVNVPARRRLRFRAFARRNRKLSG